jgi:tRNA U34 2-thiouridine synthase MnmA/TrmU
MRIVTAMSGGVDSSVAAALLAEQGHEVIGLSMQLYDQTAGERSFGSCCTLDDLHDARRVAAAIDIPHYILNFERQFEAQVVANFVREYAAGRTPLPCARCNSDLKFATLVERARGFGADAVATGHYALPAQARRRSLEGPVVLSLFTHAGPARARRVPCWRPSEGRRARVRAAASAARRRQARQPGDLLHSRR